MCVSSLKMPAIVLTIAGLMLAPAVSPSLDAAPQKKKSVAETFRGKARVTAEDAGASALVTIQIDQYTPQKDIDAMQQALQSGGSEKFLTALRGAPIAGRIEVGSQSFTIRWARQTTTAKGRVISVVTDQPVYFVGAGLPGAKARAGYDVAVLRLELDASGVGEGMMAAAAKVKPGGESGVEVEDYGSEPVKLLSVFKVIS